MTHGSKFRYECLAQRCGWVGVSPEHRDEHLTANPHHTIQWVFTNDRR